MRKKFTMLLAALFLTLGTAWAQVSYTVSGTTGTGYNGTGYFKDWTFTTSDANPATLKFTVGANNMRVVDGQLELWVGSGSTYTLSVPMYYRIVSYSFDFVKESNYSDAVTLTVDGKDYAPTLETQTVTVNNVNAASTSFKMSGANKGIKVSNFVVKIERFIELTTDPQKPKWYAIKNVRCGNYVYHNGDGGQMILRGLTGASRKAGKFYFTGEMNEDGTVYTVKIHNAATTKLCKAYNSWDEAGSDWYIKLSSNTANPGFAISNNTDYSGNGTSWNDAGGNGNSVAYWNGGDPGSTWEFVPASEYDFPEMSTTENPVLYCIRNVRQYGKYANYVAEGSALTQVATPGYGSYWYFVAAEATAPEGWVACKIYNAANATSLKNPDGTFGDQVYYIKKHEWDNNIGFAIKRSTGGDWDGWNDSEGSTVVDYDADDAGSIWWIEKAPKTAATLKSEAATAKTNALNTIGAYEFADYYTYSDEAIATAKTAIESINTNTTDLASAISGHMSIVSTLATLEASEQGSTAPVAGDVVRLKNRQYNDFLSVNGSNDLFGAASGGNELYWTLEATDVDGYYYLYNKEKNAYAKPLADENNKKTSVTTEKNEAGKYGFKQVGTTVYAALHDNHLGSGEGDAAYLHHSNWGGKEMVRWNMQASTDASHWLVNQAFPLTVVFKFKGEDIAEHKVETLLEKGATYTINNPYAGTNKYIAIGECTTTGSQPVETDGVWTVKVTEATTITVTLVDDLPFKVSESYANATWYYMNIRSDDKKYVAMSDATEYSNVAKPAADDKSLWAFMGDANGIQIINKAAGEGKTLSFEGEAAGNKPVVMREEEKTWTIERAATGFLLRAGNTGNLYVHDLDSKLKIWNSTSAPTDKGSAFNIVEDKGVKSLEELALNPRYMNVYTIQAERSPLLYDANAEHPTKLSSGMVRGIAANENDINQQFLILRTASTPEGYFYLYNLGAEKFVDENLNFIDFPSPVLSLVASEHAAYPWRVKIDNKFVIPADGGTDGNKIYHIDGGNDDDGKRYRIVKVGEYDDFGRFTTIEQAEDMIKATSELNNEKVYTVSTVNGGYWYYNSEQNALWSTGKAGVEFSAQDPAQQIAFLTVSGHTYLYSIGAQKFVVKAGDNTAYSDVPSQSIELLDAEGSRFYPFVAAFVDGDNRHHIGISNGYDIPVITNYNDLNDDGNKIKLREVTPGYMAEGAADLLAAAVIQIDNYLAAQELKPELAAKIAEVQALLDKNYLDTEDTDVLTTAKATAQTVHDKAGATSAELTEQINLLTEAIADVTYVTEISEFKNCYLYTFVSKRGWMGANETNGVISGTGADDPTNYQWAVYKSTREHYYLYNIGKAQFMGVETRNNTQMPFSATPQTTGLTFKKTSTPDYPIMFSMDNQNVVNNDKNGKMICWTGGWSKLDDEGSNHKVTIVGKIADETLTAIAAAVELYETRGVAIEALYAAITEAQAKVDAQSDVPGYYSSTIENVADVLDAIIAFRDEIDSKELAEIEAKTTAAKAISASFSKLNMPKADKFYVLRCNHENRYIYTKADDNKLYWTKDNLSSDYRAVWQFEAGTTEGTFKMKNVHNGSYIPTITNNAHVAMTNEGADVIISSSPSVSGAVIFSTTEGGVGLHAHGNNNTVIGYGNNAGANHYFFEEVTTFSYNLTVSDAGYSTLYLNYPVAVPAIEGANEENEYGVYVASEMASNYVALELVNAGDVLPAKTGVVIKAPAGNYTFTYSSEASSNVTSMFEGTLINKNIVPVENTICYVLANGNNGVGMYKAVLNQDGNTAFLNNANKAYLPVPVETSQQPAQALSWRFGRGQSGDGTTAIEGSELKAQGSQLIYDLQGRRVLNPTKGMYIVNGKKVIVK